jgi:phage shock protein PspC (stress-responsive transcriptional regulator)
MSDPTTKNCPSCFKDIDSRAARCPFCAQRQPDAPALYRDVPGRLVGGVCAALALHFNWDVTVMRVLFVGSLAVTGGLAAWVYFLVWFLTPFEARGRTPATKGMDALSNLFAKPAAQTPEQ